MGLFGFLGAPAGSSAGDVLTYAQRLDERRDANSFVSREPAATCHAEHIATFGTTTIAMQGGPLWRRGADGGYSATSLQELAESYRSSGLAFLTGLTGRFALALIDIRDRTVVLAIDPMGIERMTYCVGKDGIVFGSSAQAVARCPGIDAALNPQALFNYLLLHIVAAPATVYQQVQKLRAGTALLFKDGKAIVRRYWEPTFNEQPNSSFEDLKAQLHQSLQAAVTACEPDGATGAFLSGGLDSSSVAGMLAKVQPKSARTFSMGFGVGAYDEIGYARIASRHFETKAHEYQVTADDIVGAFDSIARAYDEPFGNSSAVPTLICAKLAREHGVRHLLAGDGGDEIFGGNERYVRQSVFEHYFRIPSWLRSGVIFPLSRAIGAESSIAPLRKLRSYVDQASVRLPERFETWNFMYRQGAEKVLDPDLLASIDPRAPFTDMQCVFDELPDASLLNRMLYYDWQYTLSDNDLRKVNTMCALGGVKVSYPMLDPRVIETSLRIPTNMKIVGTELRSFYKRAMTGFLPQEILTKQKHGFGLPFGVWLKTHEGLRELIFGHLESLRRRRIVRASFIDEIIEGHKHGDASFYGYPIWDMAMLDAWLTAHQVRAP
jgi:asparagine synthase (glutamine-hydrolysing)